MLAPQQTFPSPHAMMSAAGGFEAPRRRKRKAETQENERLSKRMSLLNIERGGTRLYVPVENPHISSIQHNPYANLIPDQSSFQQSSPNDVFFQQQHASQPTATGADDAMYLDDSKHKVYIYNLDDELSSSESDSDADNGRLVFLPDIEKHLLANRIPPRVLQNNDGELAGMQVVLYREPTSLTVPEEQDSVRKAVAEARERIREKQRMEREGLGYENQPQGMPVSSHAYGFHQQSHGGFGAFGQESPMVMYEDLDDAMDLS